MLFHDGVNFLGGVSENLAHFKALLSFGLAFCVREEQLLTVDLVIRDGLLPLC